jgi:hypothetical protein
MSVHEELYNSLDPYQEEENQPRTQSIQHLDSQEIKYDKHERFFVSNIEVSIKDSRSSSINKEQNQ